jgi:arabinogalactan oligomer/maltooligosaccharide transport system permease protein
MQNTIYVSVITSICTIFSALFMGYAFSRFRFKGRKSSLLSVMLLQMIPTLSALTVFYVLYTVLKQNYAISGLTILIFIYIGGGVAGNTFIMKGYMDSISIDIDEAAKIDGLSQ